MLSHGKHASPFVHYNRTIIQAPTNTRRANAAPASKSNPVPGAFGKARPQTQKSEHSHVREASRKHRQHLDNQRATLAAIEALIAMGANYNKILATPNDLSDAQRQAYRWAAQALVAEAARRYSTANGECTDED